MLSILRWYENECHSPKRFPEERQSLAVKHEFKVYAFLPHSIWLVCQGVAARGMVETDQTAGTAGLD